MNKLICCLKVMLIYPVFHWFVPGSLQPYIDTGIAKFASGHGGDSVAEKMENMSRLRMKMGYVHIYYICT